jgi:DNA-binding MarR family transcriptional regulator
MSINSKAGGASPEDLLPPRPAAPDFEMIELIFFAYRDFVGEPDRLLAKTGFGRAHHRVLHFVARNPGLTIAALLDILQITKQSLARVLRELVDQGYVEQRTGADDRRQRRLLLTPKGSGLATALAATQDRRITAALAAAGPDARATVGRFLEGLIDSETRADVRRRIAGGAT